MDYAKLVQRIAHEFKNPLQMLQKLDYSTKQLTIEVIKDTVGHLNVRFNHY